MTKSNLPLISIIIPTFRRPTHLKVCLESFTRIDYPRNRFEVIVVDDGSPNPPKAVLADFSEQFDVSLLTTSHAGPAKARNRGAEIANGDILAFTDDDCEPAADWLMKMGCSGSRLSSGLR